MSLRQGRTGAEPLSGQPRLACAAGRSANKRPRLSGGAEPVDGSDPDGHRNSDTVERLSKGSVVVGCHQSKGVDPRQPPIGRQGPRQHHGRQVRSGSGSAFAPCPICGKQVPLLCINIHLDSQCTGPPPCAAARPAAARPAAARPAASADAAGGEVVCVRGGADGGGGGIRSNGGGSGSDARGRDGGGGAAASPGSTSPAAPSAVALPILPGALQLSCLNLPHGPGPGPGPGPSVGPGPILRARFGAGGVVSQSQTPSPDPGSKPGPSPGFSPGGGLARTGAGHRSGLCESASGPLADCCPSPGPGTSPNAEPSCAPGEGSRPGVGARHGAHGPVPGGNGGLGGAGRVGGGGSCASGGGEATQDAAVGGGGGDGGAAAERAAQRGVAAAAGGDASVDVDGYCSGGEGTAQDQARGDPRQQAHAHAHAQERAQALAPESGRRLHPLFLPRGSGRPASRATAATISRSGGGGGGEGEGEGEGDRDGGGAGSSDGATVAEMACGELAVPPFRPIPHPELDGQYLVLDFVSPEEEAALAALCDHPAARPPWGGAGGRGGPSYDNATAQRTGTKRWGVLPDYHRRGVAPPQHPLPPLLAGLAERMRARVPGLRDFRPNEANAIDYRRSWGSWLRAHADDRILSGEVIVNLSLLGAAVMTFGRAGGHASGGRVGRAGGGKAGSGASAAADGEAEVRVLLPRRSLQVLSRAARYGHTHAIAPADLLDERRVSITFRRSELRPFERP